MTKTVDAVYEKGLLRLQEALDLRDHMRVRVTVQAPADAASDRPRDARRLPPGLGAFDSGFTDTAERCEEVLGELGFGEREVA